MLLLIVIMATERVATLSSNFRNYASAKCVIGVHIITTAIALAFAIPTAFNGFPVKIYHYRYLCAIGR